MYERVQSDADRISGDLKLWLSSYGGFTVSGLIELKGSVEPWWRYALYWVLLQFQKGAIFI